MRGRLLMVALLAVLILPRPVVAANQTVTAEPSNQFVQANVTVGQGETVTWNNGGGFHNVHFDDNAFVQPSTPDSSAWSVTRGFSAVGSFRYYCDMHGGPGGVGMSGTVTVSPTPPGTIPPPLPPQGIQSPLSADEIAPAVSLRGPRSQRVLKQRGVTLLVKSDEQSTVRARGRLTVPGAGKVLRFKSVTKKLVAGVERKIKLRLSRKALGALRRALRRGSPLVAKLTVTARDGSGNADNGRRRIRLKP